MSKNVTKLISPRVLCTSFTNRVLRLFDCFKVFYNCMSENITKLNSPRVLCTSIKNRAPYSIERLTVFYTIWTKMSQNSYIREFYSQVSKIVFVADLTVLSLIRTVSSKMSKLISPRVLCTSIKNHVPSWIGSFTAYYDSMSENVKKLILSASSVHK